MPTPAEAPSDSLAALACLDAVERGFVLGALLLGTADHVEAAAALLAPSRERCAAALAALGGLPRAERLRLTGAMAREAMAPLPAGLETVHRETLAAALAGESPATVSLVARAAPPRWRAALLEAGGAEQDREADADVVAGALASGELDPSLLAELQRAALARIAALPPRAKAAPERRALALVHLPAAALLAETAHTGAAQLGAQLAEAEGDGLGSADLLLAIAQRLPATSGLAFMAGADARRRRPSAP